MFIRWHLLYWQHVVSPIFMYENGKLPHHAWTKCSGFSISQSLLISNLHLHDIIPFPSSKLTLSLGWQTDHLCHCCNHQRSLLPLQHQAQCLFVWWTDHHHLHRRRHRHKLRGWLTETPQNWNVPEIGNLVKIYLWKYLFHRKFSYSLFHNTNQFLFPMPLIHFSNSGRSRGSNDSLLISGNNIQMAEALTNGLHDISLNGFIPCWSGNIQNRQMTMILMVDSIQYAASPFPVFHIFHLHRPIQERVCSQTWKWFTKKQKLDFSI